MSVVKLRLVIQNRFIPCNDISKLKKKKKKMWIVVHRKVEKKLSQVEQINAQRYIVDSGEYKMKYL